MNLRGLHALKVVDDEIKAYNKKHPGAKLYFKGYGDCWSRTYRVYSATNTSKKEIDKLNDYLYSNGVLNEE